MEWMKSTAFCSYANDFRTTPAFEQRLMNHEKQLLTNLRLQWEASIFQDICLVTNDGVLRAHANVLAAFSPKVATIISESIVTCARRLSPLSEHFVTLHVPFGQPEVKVVLSAVYTGVLSPPPDLVDDVLKAAEWLDLSEMVEVLKGKLGQLQPGEQGSTDDSGSDLELTGKENGFSSLMNTAGHDTFHDKTACDSADKDSPTIKVLDDEHFHVNVGSGDGNISAQLDVMKVEQEGLVSCDTKDLNIDSQLNILEQEGLVSCDTADLNIDSQLNVSLATAPFPPPIFSDDEEDDDNVDNGLDELIDHVDIVIDRDDCHYEEETKFAPNVVTEKCAKAEDSQCGLKSICSPRKRLSVVLTRCDTEGLSSSYSCGAGSGGRWWLKEPCTQNDSVTDGKGANSDRRKDGVQDIKANSPIKTECCSNFLDHAEDSTNSTHNAMLDSAEERTGSTYLENNFSADLFAVDDDPDSTTNVSDVQPLKRRLERPCNNDQRPVKKKEVRVPTLACSMCSYTFSSKGHRTRHVNAVHKGNQHLVCRHCGLKTETEVQLREHSSSVHNDPRPFACPHAKELGCKTTFRKWSRLTLHLQLTHGSRDFVCDKCGYTAPSAYILQSHQRACYQKKQFLCDVCGQAFNHKASMEKHRSFVHFGGGGKKLTCKVCNKKFDWHSNLRRHMRVHDESFPYPCPACSAKFRHSNTLKDHLTRKHRLEGAALPKIVRSEAPSRIKRGTTDDDDEDNGTGESRSPDKGWTQEGGEVLEAVTTPGAPGDGENVILGLLPKVPKQTEKPTAKTNAEKCRDYRERLKTEDQAKDRERRQKNHANAKRWRDTLGPEEKEKQRELARLRQQKRRQMLKEA